jgi:hypothetical protein
MFWAAVDQRAGAGSIFRKSGDWFPFENSTNESRYGANSFLARSITGRGVA